MQEHEFKHSSQDPVNPICNCNSDVESVIHFVLHCPLYSNKRCTLLNSLTKIDHKYNDSFLTQTLLFGNSLFTTNDSTKIISLTIDFVLSTEKFFSSFIQTIINKPTLCYFYQPIILTPGKCLFFVYICFTGKSYLYKEKKTIKTLSKIILD